MKRKNKQLHQNEKGSLPGLGGLELTYYGVGVERLTKWTTTA